MSGGIVGEPTTGDMEDACDTLLWLYENVETDSPLRSEISNVRSALNDLIEARS